MSEATLFNVLSILKAKEYLVLPEIFFKSETSFSTFKNDGFVIIVHIDGLILATISKKGLDFIDEYSITVI
jgi:hypothetical protein